MFAVAPSELGTAVRDLQASSAIKASTPAVSVVPGTEIMPSVAPQAPPAPSQGMDIVLEQLKAKDVVVEKASRAVSGPPSLPNVELPKVEFQLPQVDLSSIVEQVQSKQSELKDAAGSVDLPKLDVQLPKVDVSGSLEATKGLTDGATAAASKATAAAAEAADAAGSLVTENVQQAAALVTSATSALTEQVGTVYSSAEDLVQRALAIATGATTSVLSSVEAQVTSAVDSLPPPVRDALGAVTHAAADALQFVGADPRLGGAAVAVGFGLPIVWLWNSSFGGYAGPFSATQALEVLKSKDALLVDVRSERSRIDNGVPELKRGARGKAVALPASKLLPSVARRVRNADALAIDILGAEIAALSRRGGNTRLIILDDKGDIAKAVARAATAAGVRKVHIVDGGFRAWKSANLAIVEKSSEYDTNPLGVINDTVESVAEEAAALVKEPTNAATIIGGATALALALFNYHFTLRFIGVLGIEATIALRISQYNSPQDALDDLNAALAAAKSVAQAPLQLAEKVTAALPQESQAPPQQTTLQQPESSQ